MTRGFFITGTDTGVGKTYISCGLLHAWRMHGYTTVALKPVASGCVNTHGQWENADAWQLQQAATCPLPYDWINPVALPAPIAPSIAAHQQGVTLSVKHLLQVCQPALQQPADYHLVEGIGGWQVPLNHQETMADFATTLALPVILVVGMRLGCLNHALLAAQAIQSSGVQLHGWVANCLTPDCLALEDNINLLRRWLPASLLGVVPYQAKPGQYLTNVAY